MPTVDSYVFRLPWPPLASLDTYAQLGRVRELVAFTHGDDFGGRLILVPADGKARAWAEMVDPPPPVIDGADEPEKVRSAFEGSASDLAAADGDHSADSIVGLEQAMEFSLRTLVEVMSIAAPHLEVAWTDALRRWSDTTTQSTVLASSALPVEADVGGLIPVPVTIEAETDSELRAAYVALAFEAISPWARE